MTYRYEVDHGLMADEWYVYRWNTLNGEPETDGCWTPVAGPYPSPDDAELKRDELRRVTA